MNKRIQDIILLEEIGKESYGKVYLSKKDGINCFFETLQIDRTIADNPSFKKNLENDLHILKSLNHINIVHLEDVKSDNKYYYIVKEYINGGSLSNCLKIYKSRNNGKAFSEEIVQYLMKQIVSAIKYIHSQKIVHRNLNPDNIMVSFNNEYDKNNLNMMKATIKIIDFSFSIKLNQNNLSSNVLGNPINMDPATLKDMSNMGKKSGYLGSDQKADIWSLGTICYEMLVGIPAFNAKTMDELVKKVEKGAYSVPTNLSAETISFLNGMLQYRNEDRLSSNELFMHPFLTKNIRDFKKIDSRRVQKKINKDEININVKKNQTIWGLFNEEDEKKLLQTNANNYNQIPFQPIQKNPQINETKIRKTDVKENRILLNDSNKQNYKTNNNTYKYPGPNLSIYGQNLNQNPISAKPTFSTFSQKPIEPFIPSNQSQTQSDSSIGKGGNNFPTFTPPPTPYAFSSNIYSSPPSTFPQNTNGYSPMNDKELNSEDRCISQ